MKKINWKKFLFSSYEEEDLRDEEVEAEDISYGKLLGLNKDFEVVLVKDKIQNETDFAIVIKGVEDILKQDLQRLGENFSKIDSNMRNRLMGTIKNVIILTDDDGNVITRYHIRDEEGYWDYTNKKKYPEKGVTAKYKYEIFFITDDDDED